MALSMMRLLLLQRSCMGTSCKLEASQDHENYTFLYVEVMWRES